ncbi:hypothetical protein [Sphaerisporangium fuscum]|uniref:hypothetical protein n=1 Tax=Sphaerisporangium fuscum TaxID=2835868 RepID=UPI002029AE37|nr:hypothetical protein [Sphaerisporangium fuscum]
MFRSTTDRLWATREQPFSLAAEKAGAWRTVDADDELGLYQAIAEQESIADLAVLPHEVVEAIERQVAVLESTYPAWKIARLYDKYGAPGGWVAVRHAPLDPAEMKAGLVAMVEANDHVALVAKLSGQDVIAHQRGYAIRDHGAPLWISSPPKS